MKFDRRKLPRRWLAGGAALIVIAAGWFLGSPYYSVWALRSAAIEADTDGLQEYVDFPAVRESLKAQASAQIIQEMAESPDMRGNPFAPLGAMLAPAVMDRLIEMMVTPDGVAALIRGQSPGGEPVEPSEDIEADTSYVSIDRFRVSLRNTRTGVRGPTLVFARRGFATWKLIRIQIPSTLRDKVSSKPDSDRVDEVEPEAVATPADDQELAFDQTPPSKCIGSWSKGALRPGDLENSYIIRADGTVSGKAGEVFDNGATEYYFSKGRAKFRVIGEDTIQFDMDLIDTDGFVPTRITCRGPHIEVKHREPHGWPDFIVEVRRQ